MKSRIVKFLLTGGSAATAEYLLFIVLINFNLHIVASNSISFLSGFIISFILNKMWVFQSRGSGNTQLLMYSLLAGFNLLMGNLIISFLVNSVEMNEMISKFIVMAVIASWNYWIFSRYIFSNTQ